MARVRPFAVLLPLGLFAMACDKAEPPPAEPPAAVTAPAVAASSEPVAAAPLPSPSVEPPPALSGSAPPANSASAPDPQLARKVALEQAAQMGVLGVLKTANPNELAPWETTDRIEEDSSGGLIGADAGESFGGLDLSGIGRGGGGVVDGSIGTIGHGTGVGGLNRSTEPDGKGTSARSGNPDGKLPTIAGKPLAEAGALDVERALRDAGCTEVSSKLLEHAKGVVVFEVTKGGRKLRITFVAATTKKTALPAEELARLRKRAKLHEDGDFLIAVESDDDDASKALLDAIVKQQS